MSLVNIEKFKTILEWELKKDKQLIITCDYSFLSSCLSIAIIHLLSCPHNTVMLIHLLLYIYYNDSLLSHLTIITIHHYYPISLKWTLLWHLTIMTIHNYYLISKNKEIWSLPFKGQQTLSCWFKAYLIEWNSYLVLYT